MSDHWLITGSSQVIRTSHSITTFRGILAQNRSQPLCFIRIKTHFPLLSSSTFHSALYRKESPEFYKETQFKSIRLNGKLLKQKGHKCILKKRTPSGNWKTCLHVTQTPPLSVLPSAGEQQWEFSNPECLYRRTSFEHSWQVDPTPPPSGLVAFWLDHMSLICLPHLDSPTPLIMTRNVFLQERFISSLRCLPSVVLHPTDYIVANCAKNWGCRHISERAQPFENQLWNSSPLNKHSVALFSRRASFSYTYCEFL